MTTEATPETQQQTQKNQQTKRSEAIQRLQEMIADVQVAMLTTTRPDQSLYARPMVNVNQQFDGDLWFFCDASGDTASQIAANPRVNVSFVGSDGQTYVSISGRGEFVSDPKKQELLWTDAITNWFPGPKHEGVGLIRVDVDDAHYWDQTQGTMVAFGDLLKRLVTGVVKVREVKAEEVTWPEEAKEPPTTIPADTQ